MTSQQEIARRIVATATRKAEEKKRKTHEIADPSPEEIAAERLNCSSEWHLAAHRNWLVLAIYSFAMRITDSKRDENGRRLFWISIRNLAEYFGAHHHTIEKALAQLTESGFFRLVSIGGIAQRKADGKMMATTYEVLSHSEFAARNPGSCIDELACGFVDAARPVAATRPTACGTVAAHHSSPDYSSMYESSPERENGEQPPADHFVGKTDGLERYRGSSWLPLTEMRTAVMDETGQSVFFPAEHHSKYRRLVKQYGPLELIQAVRNSCKSLGHTFDFRGFSGRFLTVAETILRANRLQVDVSAAQSKMAA